MGAALEAEAFFDRLVLISNSVPKSGSTFLFSLQQDFLLRVAGRAAPDHAPFTDAGVEVSHGFVSRPLVGPFLDVLERGEIRGGPHILKTHMTVTPRLRALLAERPTLFMSLAVRDPVEVFLSARDNHRKTGEFPEFADLEAGCGLLLGYFTGILRSAREAGGHKALPVVRYEDIVTDPLRALVASLHPEILRNVTLAIAARHTDMDRARRFSANRLNLGQATRLEAEPDTALLAELVRRLSGARAEFGYG